MGIDPFINNTVQVIVSFVVFFQFDKIESPEWTTDQKPSRRGRKRDMEGKSESINKATTLAAT